MLDGIAVHVCVCGAQRGEPHRDQCPRWAQVLRCMNEDEARRAEAMRKKNLERWRSGLFYHWRENTRQ